MDDVRNKLSAICQTDNERLNGILSRAVPTADVEKAVLMALDHVRAIPDALVFVQQRVDDLDARGLERLLTEYLMEPMDPQPETLMGAYGYLDDAYLVVGAALCLEDAFCRETFTAWGGLDDAATARLRDNQEAVRRLLHPDVAAFQDALLSMMRTCAEEARRRAAVPALRSRRARTESETTARTRNSFPQFDAGVYASLA